MMKRYIPVVLALLLLGGCAGNMAPDMEPVQTTQSGKEETTLYAPGSAVEQQTQGAVTMYPLPAGEYTALFAMGDRLVLVSGNEEKKLLVLTGEGGIPSAPVSVPDGFSLDGIWQSTHNGLMYYDATGKQAVMLDTQLGESKRIDLPELDGAPVFSQDGSRIYYCKGNEIRALELELGIDRLIRTHSCRSQILKGSLLAGKVLICQLEDENRQQRLLYLSAETGESLSDDQNVLSLESGDSYYLASRQEGTLTQKLVGTMDGRPMSLMMGEGQTLRSALSMNGLVGCKTGEDRCLELSYYDLQEGKLTASVKVRGVGTPEHYLADKWSGSIWFLSQDPATNTPALFRWKVSKSCLENGPACVTTWYDASAPDTAGISRLKTRADKLGSTYGVSVRIWQDAVKKTDRYILEAEHQTTAISGALDELETVLSSYPEKFLSKSAGNKIRICIVRSISREITGAQFWSGSDPYILLCVGCDMQEEFAKALSYVVISRTLGNSSKMDGWQSLNPQGFQYGTTPDKSLLEGNTRAFADASAAVSVTEDRASIFWQALRPDNGDLFASDTMQKKLSMLCKAIRDAYSMKKRTEVFPWEQYLQKPIAYVKK